MNKTEQTALKYITDTIGKNKVKFQRHDSPDFIIIGERTAYEVKRLYGRSIWFYESQFAKMKNSGLDISILVFENGHTQPTALLPMALLENGKSIDNITIKIVPDMPLLKAEATTRTELQKVAGEVQAVRGGNVSLSEAIDFLIQFYREHKEA